MDGYFVVRNRDNDWVDGFGIEFPDPAIEQTIPVGARFYRIDLAQEYRFSAAGTWNAAGGGSAPTVQEVDGAPAVANASTIKFDQDDGFVLTDEGGGVVRVDFTGGGAHAASHQNGGGDEISVAGLSGLLADDQNPTAHASDHQNGGGDEISVAGLSGQLADAQPVTVRKNSGANVGTRARLNFIEGSNIVLTVADDAGDGEVDVTIESTGAAAPDNDARWLAF